MNNFILFYNIMKAFKNTQIKEISPDNFVNKILNDKSLKNKQGMIFFGAPWCKFCVEFAPIYVGVSEVLGTAFPLYYMDCEKYGQFASEKFNVSGYPTLMFIDRNGMPYKKYSQERNENTILQEICNESRICYRLT